MFNIPLVDAYRSGIKRGTRYALSFLTLDWRSSAASSFARIVTVAECENHHMLKNDNITATIIQQ
jgi:hypothetical protein